MGSNKIINFVSSRTKSYGPFNKSYRVSTYRQDIHIEPSHHVISLALKMECRQAF